MPRRYATTTVTVRFQHMSTPSVYRLHIFTGPGSGANATLMLGVLNSMVQAFEAGPNATYTNSAGQPFTPGPLLAMFTNDGQLSQLVSELGVFDDVAPLPSMSMPLFQKYVSSNFITMRGTTTLERLTCSASNATTHTNSTTSYVRVLLNDAVYPVVGCASGPGYSCPLSQYGGIVAGKMATAGSLRSRCNITNATLPVLETATFLRDNALPFQINVKP